MTRPVSMQRIAVALAASLTLLLSACQHQGANLQWGSVAREVGRQAAWAPACPTPTERQKLVTIKAELEAAIAAGAAPDTLASEWDRLDSASRACRGQR